MPVFAQITLDPAGVVAWVAVGLVAGFLAGRVTRGSGYGPVGDVGIGLVGAVAGGLLVGLFVTGTDGLVGGIAVASVAACLLILGRAGRRPGPGLRLTPGPHPCGWKAGHPPTQESPNPTGETQGERAEEAGVAGQTGRPGRGRLHGRLPGRVRPLRHQPGRGDQDGRQLEWGNVMCSRRRGFMDGGRPAGKSPDDRPPGSGS